MYGSDEKALREITLGDGKLKLSFDGNPLALGPTQRKLIEDLLTTIEHYPEQKEQG